MGSIKINELRPTTDYPLCVLEAHGLAEPSIKDYHSTFGAFERYVNVNSTKNRGKIVNGR